MGEKEKSLEDKVLDKKIVSFSAKDLKWVITTAVAVVLWIVTAVLWVQDKNTQKEAIDKLKIENGSLKTKVTLLEGQVQGISQAATTFMENSPSENRYRIELLEKRVEVLELPGSNPPPIVHTLDTTNVIRRER